MPIESATATPPSPGRPGLAFETYEKAYHDLTSDDGIPPSQRQLRKYLGTGSNTTLAGYRRRIAADRDNDKLPAEPTSIDAALLATVRQLATQLALDEARVADDRVDEIQQEADNRIRIAETTMEKRLKDTALLEHRANTAEAELKELRETVNEKDAMLVAKQEAYLALKEQHATLNQSLIDANRRIDEQAQQLSDQDELHNATRAAEQAAADKGKTDLAELQGDLTALRSEHTTLTEKHKGLQVRFDERTALIENQTAQQTALQARLDKSIEVGEDTLNQLDVAKNERDALNLQSGELAAALSAEKQLHQAALEQNETRFNDQRLLVAQLRDTVSALTDIKKQPIKTNETTD